MSINSETQCVALLFLSSRFMTYAPSFILGKLFLEKAPLNLQSVTYYLRLTLVYMQKAHHGKSLIAIFRDLFANIKIILIFAGRMDLRLSFCGV